MSNNSTTSPALQSEAESAVHLLDDCFDPIEAGLRERVREFIQAMIREAALVRPRYGRRPKADATNGNVFGDADSRQHERAGAESDRRRWQRCVLMKQNHPLHARRRGTYRFGRRQHAIAAKGVATEHQRTDCGPYGLGSRGNVGGSGSIAPYSPSAPSLMSAGRWHSPGASSRDRCASTAINFGHSDASRYAGRQNRSLSYDRSGQTARHSAR